MTHQQAVCLKSDKALFLNFLQLQILKKKNNLFLFKAPSPLLRSPCSHFAAQPCVCVCRKQRLFLLSSTRGFWQGVILEAGMGSGDTRCCHSSGQRALGWGGGSSLAMDLAELEGRTHVLACLNPFPDFL